jgi:tyrosyl-tRNA synthetase
MRLITRWTPDKITEIESGIISGDLHPRDAKKSIAREIVSIFHDEKMALQAEKSFEKVFQQKDIPDEIPEYALLQGQTIIDVLTVTGLVSSKSDGRRMIEQKGVKLDGDILSQFDIPFPHPGVLQVGKRRFIRIK